MKENLINLKNQLIESQKNNSEPGYVFVNVNDSLVNGDTHYSEEYYNNMIVPANIAAYKVIKYYESQLENHKKLKHTTSDKVDLEIGIEVVVKGKTYEAEKRKHYKYEDMVVIAPYAFTDLGPGEDRIYLEDVIVPEEERVKTPYMAVNYEEFFKEMKDYGMPLTIYLVKSISGNVSGLTDAKDTSNIKIMIEPALLFENTLHHEIMHYIDSYISVKGYPIDINSTMKDVNPVGFSYGDKSNDYIYYSTNANDAYFLSAYSKTNYLEDRAVIFSDLMFRSFTKDCYADGTPINKKAKLISSQIKSHFKTLSNTGRYYWDRFL